MEHEPILLAPEEPEPVGPPLPGRVVVRADRESVCEALGTDLLAAAHDAVARRGVFHLAVSGGSTPFPFYQSLMTDPMYRSLPWERTHLWIVDERRVAFDDDKSNWGKIAEIFCGHSGMPDSQVHPMEATHADAAASYETLLRAQLGAMGSLDFVILGMGDNGHTASLFPHTSVLDERTRWIGDCDGPTVTPPARVTMTYPLINAARAKAVLVVGNSKAEMIARVATGSDDLHELPIKGIGPSASVTWYLDRAACGL